MTSKTEIDAVESNHMLKENIGKNEEAPNIPTDSQESENNFQVSLSEDSNESISTNEHLSMESDFKGHKLDYVSENLDSALDSESNESDTTTSTTDKRLSETITYQQRIIEQNAETIKSLEEKLNYLELTKQDLSTKFEQVRISELHVFNIFKKT